MGEREGEGGSEVGRKEIPLHSALTNQEVPNVSEPLPALTVTSEGAIAVNFDKVVSVLNLIHKDSSYWIGFVRKPANRILDRYGKPINFQTLGAIELAELASVWAKLAPFLTHDAYFTVNTYYGPARWLNKHTGFADLNRKEDRLMFLNAAFCDLDIGRATDADARKRISTEEGRATVEKLVAEGVIPPVSIITESGRGLYLFWLVKDEDGCPIHANFGTKRIYKLINRALGARLSHLAVDVGAHDCARVLRVPDSIHSKTGKRVVYHVQSETRYTFRQLSEFLGVSLEVAAKRSKKNAEACQSECEL